LTWDEKIFDPYDARTPQTFAGLQQTEICKCAKRKKNKLTHSLEEACVPQTTFLAKPPPVLLPTHHRDLPASHKLSCRKKC
jgi:hypothetical protein